MARMWRRRSKCIGVTLVRLSKQRYRKPLLDGRAEACEGGNETAANVCGGARIGVLCASCPPKSTPVRLSILSPPAHANPPLCPLYSRVWLFRSGVEWDDVCAMQRRQLAARINVRRGPLHLLHLPSFQVIFLFLVFVFWLMRTAAMQCFGLELQTENHVLFSANWHTHLWVCCISNQRQLCWPIVNFLQRHRMQLDLYWPCLTCVRNTRLYVGPTMEIALFFRCQGVAPGSAAFANQCLADMNGLMSIRIFDFLLFCMIESIAGYDVLQLNVIVPFGLAAALTITFVVQRLVVSLVRLFSSYRSRSRSTTCLCFFAWFDVAFSLSINTVVLADVARYGISFFLRYYFLFFVCLNCVSRGESIKLSASSSDVREYFDDDNGKLSFFSDCDFYFVIDSAPAIDGNNSNNDWRLSSVDAMRINNDTTLSSSSLIDSGSGDVPSVYDASALSSTSSLSSSSSPLPGIKNALFCSLSLFGFNRFCFRLG